jgi:hypothetical protein
MLFASSFAGGWKGPNRLKNQQLGGSQVVVCKIVGGRAKQPNLNSARP